MGKLRRTYARIATIDGIWYESGGERMENILELKDVCKTYPNSDFKLDDITFSVPTGSIVGFIGENGAGKTTTMGTVLGTLKKDSGSIKLFGKNITANDIAQKEKVGAVFDAMNFSENLNVKQLANVMRHIYKQWDEERFFQYVRQFSLPVKTNIQGFSRGMSMKLSIAVALSHDAKLLMLDEATAGLDPVAREEILDLLLEYVSNGERAIFLSSHITSDIEKIADELIFIKKGRIMLRVHRNELLQKYAIIVCKPNEYKHIDHQSIVVYRQKGDVMEVLVSNKHNLPSSMKTIPVSIDDVSLLIMKGEHNERSFA